MYCCIILHNTKIIFINYIPQQKKKYLASYILTYKTIYMILIEKFHSIYYIYMDDMEKLFSLFFSLLLWVVKGRRRLETVKYLKRVFRIGSSNRITIHMIIPRGGCKIRQRVSLSALMAGRVFIGGARQERIDQS